VSSEQPWKKHEKVADIALANPSRYKLTIRARSSEEKKVVHRAICWLASQSILGNKATEIRFDNESLRPEKGRLRVILSSSSLKDDIEKALEQTKIAVVASIAAGVSDYEDSTPAPASVIEDTNKDASEHIEGHAVETVAPRLILQCKCRTGDNRIYADDLAVGESAFCAKCKSLFLPVEHG